MSCMFTLVIIIFDYQRTSFYSFTKIYCYYEARIKAETGRKDGW